MRISIVGKIPRSSLIRNRRRRVEKYIRRRSLPEETKTRFPIFRSIHNFEDPSLDDFSPRSPLRSANMTSWFLIRPSHGKRIIDDNKRCSLSSHEMKHESASLKIQFYRGIVTLSRVNHIQRSQYSPPVERLKFLLDRIVYSFALFIIFRAWWIRVR